MDQLLLRHQTLLMPESAHAALLFERALAYFQKCDPRYCSRRTKSVEFVFSFWKEKKKRDASLVRLIKRSNAQICSGTHFCKQALWRTQPHVHVKRALEKRRTNKWRSFSRCATFPFSYMYVWQMNAFFRSERRTCCLHTQTVVQTKTAFGPTRRTCR